MSIHGATPAGIPPQGLTSNLISPPHNNVKFITVNVAFLSTAAIFCMLRVYTRAAILRSFAADDYLMLLAMCLSIVLSGLTLNMLQYGLGKHIWDVAISDLSPGFLKFNLIAAMVYCGATGLSKASILLFYLRIFPMERFRFAVWSICFFEVGYSVGCIFANIFSCDPIAKSWDATITKGKCIDRPALYFANAGLLIFTDFATLLLPLRAIQRLQLPLRVKLFVAVVLMMGGFVCIISIVRLVTLVPLLKSKDLTYNTSNALLWCHIELNLSIVGGSVPAMKPFMRQYFPSLIPEGKYSGSGSGSSGRKRYDLKCGSQGSRTRDTSRSNIELMAVDSQKIYQNGTPSIGYSNRVKAGSQGQGLRSMSESEEYVVYNGGELPKSDIMRTVSYRVEDASLRPPSEAERNVV